MLKNTNVKKIFVVFVVLILSIITRLSYADGDSHRDSRNYYSYHNHPRFGLHVSFIPERHFSIRVGGAIYYYYDGVYYSGIGREYVIVHPPVGAVVYTIPPDFRPVVINGVTYYTDNGIFYRNTSQGFEVVAPPAVANQPESFTVNVPYFNGTYVSIVIRKSGNGYVGPKGEFYPKFPNVSQLKAIYGK